MISFIFRWSLFFYFSNSNIGFNALNRSCAKVDPGKDFKQDILVGANVFWKFSEGNKNGGEGIQCFVVVQWGKLVEAGQFFLNELQK